MARELVNMQNGLEIVGTGLILVTQHNYVIVS